MTKTIRSSQFRALHGAPDKGSGGIEAKILSFKDLPEGWNYGEDGPATAEAVSAAVLLHRIGRGLGFRVNAFPAREGAVTIAFYHRDLTVETTVRGASRVDVRLERGFGMDFDLLDEVDGVSVREAVQHLKRLAGHPWHLSDSSTQGSLIQTEGGLQAKHFATHPATGATLLMGEGESPSLSLSAHAVNRTR